MSDLPAIKFAKPAFDIGLFTSRPDEMVAFWQAEPGFDFDHVLRITRTLTQHRVAFGDGVLKINTPVEASDDRVGCTFGSILISSTNVASPQASEDPDSNPFLLVPVGYRGIHHWGLEVRGADLSAFMSFYTQLLGFSEVPDHEGVVLCGASALVFAEDKSAALNSNPSPLEKPGIRYMTVQVFDVDEVYARIIEHGGTGVRAPVTLGKTARIAFVADPFGNWIELSQRASLVGALA